MTAKQRTYPSINARLDRWAEEAGKLGFRATPGRLKELGKCLMEPDKLENPKTILELVKKVERSLTRDSKRMDGTVSNRVSGTDLSSFGYVGLLGIGLVMGIFTGVALVRRAIGDIVSSQHSNVSQLASSISQLTKRLDGVINGGMNIGMVVLGVMTLVFAISTVATLRRAARSNERALVEDKVLNLLDKMEANIKARLPNPESVTD
jgi:hypothetical protein